MIPLNHEDILTEVALRADRKLQRDTSNTGESSWFLRLTFICTSADLKKTENDYL